jgi:uncharacterized protein with GYD domain
MAGYMILGKFREGPPDMSHMDKDISDLKAGVEKMGARIIGMWGLMGRFDMLMVLDAPDEMTAVGIAAQAGKAMNASTETARAFSEDEMAALGRQMAR